MVVRSCALRSNESNPTGACIEILVQSEVNALNSAPHVRYQRGSNYRSHGVYQLYIVSVGGTVFKETLHSPGCMQPIKYMIIQILSLSSVHG